MVTLTSVVIKVKNDFNVMRDVPHKNAIVYASVFLFLLFYYFFLLRTYFFIFFSGPFGFNHKQTMVELWDIVKGSLVKGGRPLVKWTKRAFNWQRPCDACGPRLLFRAVRTAGNRAPPPTFHSETETHRD